MSDDNLFAYLGVVESPERVKTWSPSACTSPEGLPPPAPAPESARGEQPPAGTHPAHDLDPAEREEWTVRHNNARDQAAIEIKIQCPQCDVYTEFPIIGASKVNSGNNGSADILACDRLTKVCYVWEVKHICGAQGECGAESKGPADLDWYIEKFDKQFAAAGLQLRKGWNLRTRLYQPDPNDPRKSTLVTASSVDEGRPSPEFDGVIIYWTEKKKDSHENMRGYYWGKNQGRADKAADQPSFWEWWWEHSGSPEPPTLIPGIRVPIRIPPLVPVP